MVAPIQLRRKSTTMWCWSSSWWEVVHIHVVTCYMYTCTWPSHVYTRAWHMVHHHTFMHPQILVSRKVVGRSEDLGPVYSTCCTPRVCEFMYACHYVMYMTCMYVCTHVCIMIYVWMYVERCTHVKLHVYRNFTLTSSTWLKSSEKYKKNWGTGDWQSDSNVEK